MVSINHVTTYRYRKPVGFGEHRMMLRPLEAFDQRLISTELEISPEPRMLRRVHDVSDSSIDVASFALKADHLTFNSHTRVEHHASADFDLETASLSAGARKDPYDRDEALGLAASLSRRHPDSGEVEAWARAFLTASPQPVSSVLIRMTQAIRADFAYSLRLRGAPQTPQETLAARQGSCRDFAVLMMESARSLGLAARFVSGYVYSCSPSTAPTGGGHTHAWARVYVPGCGWVDFDPTNGIIGNFDLIRVAVVNDPRLALPLYGSWDGDADDYLGMEVNVDIRVEPELQQMPQLRVAASR